MGRMGSDEFARAVIDGDEDIGPFLIRRDCLGHIRPPDLIHALGDYGPIVKVLGSKPGTMGCVQPILLHDPSHPPRRRTDAFVPKPDPNLAVVWRVSTPEQIYINLPER